MTHCLGFVLVLACSLAVGDQPEKRMVVQPDDTGGALVNPGMGWTLHYYSNHDRELRLAGWSRPTRSTTGPVWR